MSIIPLPPALPATRPTFPHPKKARQPTLTLILVKLIPQNVLRTNLFGYLPGPLDVAFPPFSLFTLLTFRRLFLHLLLLRLSFYPPFLLLSLFHLLSLFSLARSVWSVVCPPSGYPSLPCVGGSCHPSVWRPACLSKCFSCPLSFFTSFFG